MAERYFCDRCDSEKDEFDLVVVGIGAGDVKEVDLCEKCIKALQRFLKIKLVD